MSQMPKRILWFAPEAGLWPSAKLENDLANAWSAAGVAITVIRCRGVLDSYCPVMTAEGISPESLVRKKKVACKECTFNRSILDKPNSSAYEVLWLDDFISSDIRQSANQVRESVTKDNWSDLYRNDIPIGRYSSYLTLLHHKVPDPTAHEKAWLEYQSDLYNSVMVLDALPEIFDVVRPELSVVYNPLYPTHRVFAEVSAGLGIPMVNVTAGGFIPDRYSSIALYPKIHSSQTSRDSVNIQRGMKTPLSELEIAAVTRQISHQILGRDPWVYSSPPSVMSSVEIRTRLGLRPQSPAVVVLVGSPDETRSSELVGAEYARTSSQLSDVLEFVEQSLKAAHSMPDVDFVIRLHPRMLANKRERLDSPDLAEIFRVLESAPANVHINQSGDGIGLYDTARIAGVGLNHASTSGLEFLVLGIPVVHYDPSRLNAYPSDFGSEVQRLDTSELVEKINEALSDGWSSTHSLHAYRWLATTLLRALIHRNSIDVETTELGSPELNQSAPEQPHRPHSLRGLIPESLREAIARHQARMSRSREFQVPRVTNQLNADVAWKSEAQDRLREMNFGEIWEPLIYQRGEPLAPDAEARKIQLAVRNFIEQIGGLEIHSLRS